MNQNILNRVAVYAKERHIDTAKPTIEGFIANITEELGEWLEACKVGDEQEMIDAVADITIFSLTELLKFSYAFKKEDNWFNTKLNYLSLSRNGFNYKIVNIFGAFSNGDETMYLVHIVNACLVQIHTMGYEQEHVMDEVLKVVCSRTGEWDDVNGKFQKDTTDEAKARWYKPKYIKRVGFEAQG